MSMARRASAAAVAAVLTLGSSGIAHADNSNDNTNTNNNSDFGGYLDTGSGSDDSKMWPPTKLDWPPSDISTAGVSDSGKGGDSGSGKATPIVMPDGQSPPPKEDGGSTSTSTSTTPTPIVPAGG